ncbi:MAG TPA: S53 family peptidase [Thermomicrobiaceae bacterium]|nr:S53 family peptidase [Thermomicrobiaceae bacterium]
MLSALVISLGLAPTVAMAMPVDPLVGHFGTSQRVCTDAGPGTASCTAEVRTDPAAMSATPARGGIKPNAVGNGGAYDPSYLQSAYNVASLAKSAGGGQTVAIVDAYDDPNVAKDLSYYRAYFGLSACTTSSGCFRKVNQTGGSRYPSRNVGWAEEISLDVEMVSAICPNCKILLVEASSSSFSNLLTAVDTAVKSGAKYVSMSWGAAEFSGETGYDGHFNNAAIAFTVAAGDSGYGVDYPAASPYVTAVGGTSLNQATNTGTRNATETAWSGTGSGCSAYEAKPAWQTDGGCSGRTVNDVSAVADPNTGVWAYDTYGQHGWLIFGGTSVATPIIASVYALAGNGATAQHTYANTQSLNDVTSGSDGSCGTAYLCTAAPSYDGPTGNGTPNGDGAF